MRLNTEKSYSPNQTGSSFKQTNMKDDSANSSPRNYIGKRQTGARLAILTLTAINFLNYADRYVPSSVKSLIQTDLKLSDFETSLPSTGSCLPGYSFIDS